MCKLISTKGRNYLISFNTKGDLLSIWQYFIINTYQNLQYIKTYKALIIT